jgi:predicted lipid-binding transport protein (Tim44 family)
MVAVPLFGRAGGAGGDSFGNSGDIDFGDGGGDGGGGLIIFLFYLLFNVIPFPFNIILLILIVAVSAWMRKKNKQKSVLNNYTPSAVDLEPGVLANPRFLENLPDFNKDDFKEKVRVSFLAIQEAWSKKDLSEVRKYISDGIYQRFKTQFLMMDLLKQQNQVTNVVIDSITISEWKSDGPYDVITARITARANDRFVCELLPEVNSGGSESFTEYWAYIKKRGNITKDLYRDPKCPGCGAPVTGVEGGVSKCPYCKKLLNSGEYDWVLSEITQASDYAINGGNYRKHQKLEDQVRLMEGENPDFAVQILEDRASNVFLHLMSADSTKEMNQARRYVSDPFFDKAVKRGYFLNRSILYSRLYLNHVDLIAAGKRDGKNILAIALKQSGQQVNVEETGFRLVNKIHFSWYWVILLERDEMTSLPSGAVTAYSCPHCGGELRDSAETHCQYCKEPLNSTRFDWVVTDLFSADEYDRFLADNPGLFNISLEPDPLVTLFKVRDFAMNNVMVLMAADGTFTKEEKDFAEKIGKKWGYDIRQLEGFLQLAAAGKLTIRMPDDRKTKEKILALMQKAAESDNVITPEEQKTLEMVKRNWLS